MTTATEERTYICTVCGHRGPWSDDWYWWGSLAEPVVIACSVWCRERARKGTVTR